MVLEELLDPVEAPPTHAAGQDRAEEHPVALRDAGWKVGLGPDLLEDPHRLVAQDPRRRRAWIAVEEGPDVGPADPARLDPQDPARALELALLGVSDLDRVDVGHEGGAHHR